MYIKKNGHHIEVGLCDRCSRLGDKDAWGCELEYCLCPECREIVRAFVFKDNHREEHYDLDGNACDICGQKAEVSFWETEEEPRKHVLCFPCTEKLAEFMDRKELNGDF